MKSLKVFFLTLFVIASIQVVSVYAVEEDEFIILIETAKTPEDHQKIVDYYEVMTLRMEKMVNKHKSKGEAYEKRSKPMSGMSKNCSKLSEEYKESANVCNEMLQHHKEMADGKHDHDAHHHE